MGACNSFCSPDDSELQTADGPIKRRERLDNQSNASEDGEGDIDDPQMELIAKFFRYVTEGNKTAIEGMLGENPEQDLLNSTYEDASPLHVAVQHKQLALLEYFLVTLSASPNVQQLESGDTPMHMAVRYGHMDAVQLLYEAEADLSIENEEGDKPLHIAISIDGEIHKEISHYLEPDDAVLKKLRKAKQTVETPGAAGGDGLLAVGGDADEDIQETFKDQAKSVKVSPLKDWLERKQRSPPYSWLRRWVVAEGGYLMWSERQVTIGENGVDENERKRWNRAVFLTDIEDVVAQPGKKKKTQFTVKIGKKEYLFRTKSEEKRNYWVEHLKESIEWAQSNGLYNEAAAPEEDILSD